MQRQKDKVMPECYVEMQHQSTFSLFQTFTKTNDMEHFHAFNIHDIWARQMVMGEGIDTRGGESITADSESHVHLVIVGMTEMGMALAREAAMLCHYPNYVTKGIRTKITFIDPKANEGETFFKGHYRHLFEVGFLDVEFEFIQANIADKYRQYQIARWATDEKEVLTIAVCTDLPHGSMAVGLYLPDAVFENNIPVWVYQPAMGDMRSYLVESRFTNLTPFGMSGKDLDIKNEKIVRQAKRLNHFYCNKKKDIEEEWKKCSVFEKWSNIYNVSAIPAKLRGVGGDIDKNNEHLAEAIEKNIDILAEVEHNRWNVEKLLMGFRPTTNEEHEQIKAGEKSKKALKVDFIHDDIRPYDELDDETREIDRKFAREILNIIGE